jgi:hypothetical protein
MGFCLGVTSLLLYGKYIIVLKCQQDTIIGYYASTRRAVYSLLFYIIWQHCVPLLNPVLSLTENSVWLPQGWLIDYIDGVGKKKRKRSNQVETIVHVV